MIKDIDDSRVMGAKVIDSPYLGSISTERLSGGFKTLILMSQDHEHIFNASACGDNCAKWILHIAKMLEKEDMDLFIRLEYLMDFGDETFDIEVENIGIVYHNQQELVEAVLDNGLL